MDEHHSNASDRASDRQWCQAEDVTFTAADWSMQRYVRLLPAGPPPERGRCAVIALHGHGSDRWQFIRDPRDECRAFRDVALAHNAVFISPDYRAPTSWMGPAAENDILVIIDRLREVEHCPMIILAGGSMGGTAALIFAFRHPQPIAGVCSLNGTANMLEFDGFSEAIAAAYGGTRQQLPHVYRERSAEFFPQRFTMPVALTAGGCDTVVPPHSVLRLAAGLEREGAPVLLLYRPEGGHATDYADSAAALEFALTGRRE